MHQDKQHGETAQCPQPILKPLRPSVRRVTYSISCGRTWASKEGTYHSSVLLGVSVNALAAFRTYSHVLLFSGRARFANMTTLSPEAVVALALGIPTLLLSLVTRWKARLRPYELSGWYPWPV